MTYSIVARDADTGRDGRRGAVALVRRSASVVTWAEAGVGVVATQAFAERSYGPLGLGARCATERRRPDALSSLLIATSRSDRRQVAMVDTSASDRRAHGRDDASPRPATSSGTRYSAQANMMLRCHGAGRDGVARTSRRPATSSTVCSPRSTRPRPKAATSAVGSRLRCSSWGREGGDRGGGASSRCVSRTTPSRSSSCADSSAVEARVPIG